MDDHNINYITITNPSSSTEHKLEEIVNFTKNKVISADGLTLVEVFQALVQMMNSDLKLVKEVLVHANIMVKHGMRVAKESELRRHEVLKFLRCKKNVISRQDCINKPSTIPITKQIKKRVIGF
ncbi:hypothetical protein GOY13_03325 [Wolbachia endosymbiont of Cruorifilaria tuberocauda]|uniref:hypothetical protein n=1 Tax=Wolbachia endosymbiont of Cruorifilaria tuberocauda TaxID=1812111 RepID=UPI001588F9A1|nr:hypothetical protein [Wolbachia endosymbiont of Cruorifilaria tuberocauda]QKX01922.1 hypothetical protein GOY13_03325 [Wolbachia endosymbiont of Cruorifilaria tuberocauda]